MSKLSRLQFSTFTFRETASYASMEQGIWNGHASRNMFADFNSSPPTNEGLGDLLSIQPLRHSKPSPSPAPFDFLRHSGAANHAKREINGEPADAPTWTVASLPSPIPQRVRCTHGICRLTLRRPLHFFQLQFQLPMSFDLPWRAFVVAVVVPKPTGSSGNGIAASHRFPKRAKKA